MTAFPFFANTEDDTHCYQAVLKMVLKHFEPQNDYSWQELDNITNKPAGLWTWAMAGLSWLATHGYEVVVIESFDYHRFADEGIAYMLELWGKPVVDEQTKHSDIPLAQKDARQFLQTVDLRQDIPSLAQINDYLMNGCAVFCNINAAGLDNRNDFVGHYVLIIDISSTHVILHDPGLPPAANRQVSYEQFERAWAAPNESAKNLMAVRLPAP